MTKCAKQHDDAEESYTWCRTGAHIDGDWDYCGLKVRKKNINIATSQEYIECLTIQVAFQ